MAKTDSVDSTFLKERAVEENVPSAITNDRGEIDYGDLIYQQKAQLLNSAIEEIGMGNYQWYRLWLFF